MHALHAENNPIAEAKRSIANAKKILKEKAGLDGDGYYSDTKYVKMAGHTAYCGMLVALDAVMEKEPIKIATKGRKSEDTYRKFLARRNRTMLKHFNSAYNYLHILCGYEGDLRLNTPKEGMIMGNAIIQWSETQL